MSLRRRRNSDQGARGVVSSQQDNSLRRVGSAGINRGPLVSERFDVNGFMLSVCLSDITDEPVDAIVNSIDEDLASFTSGLPKRIIDQGGDIIFQKVEALAKKNERKVGDVLVTESGLLPCSRIMHIVMSKNQANQQNTYTSNEVIKDSVLECLNRAQSRNMKSIAFPLVGPEPVDIKTCAKAMLDALDDYMKASETMNEEERKRKHVITDIRFILSDVNKHWVLRDETRRRYADCMVPVLNKPEYPHPRHCDGATSETQHMPDKEELKSQLDSERQERKRLAAMLAEEQEAKKMVERQFIAEREARQEAERQNAAALETVRKLEREIEQYRCDQKEREHDERGIWREALQHTEIASDQLDEQNCRLELERQIQRLKDEVQQLRNDPKRETRDWVLARDEVVLCDTAIESNVIGRGAFAEVIKGKFRGTTVAVKRLHNIILSQRNRGRFEREMNMASRCRHPCLLQFIGATAEDQHAPLLVTEVMETSLRALLRERGLRQDEVSTISLDTSQGFNYLHLNRPDPIIHRDITSSNVLLWKQNGAWRAKVSDYGTANFIQLCVTLRPGAAIYSAPEADRQFEKPTTKIDVYSFGVLLCEMNIAPEQLDATKRSEQVTMITNRHHKELIKSCIDQEPSKRPSMAEIIDILERAKESPRMAISETS